MFVLSQLAEEERTTSEDWILHEFYVSNSGDSIQENVEGVYWEGRTLRKSRTFAHLMEILPGLSLVNR